MHINTTGDGGIHITFENDWTVSIQIGPGRYNDNYDTPPFSKDGQTSWSSRTAEVAVIGPDGEFLILQDDSVLGWQTPTQILAILNRVSNF